MLKTKISYPEKLKDPRWQKKRLEILERDEWCCQGCFGSDETLHVHHKVYISGEEPWDTPSHLLVTLCENCHKEEKQKWKDYGYNMLIRALKENFMGEDIYSIANGFLNIKMPRSPEVTASIIEWTLKSEYLMKDLESKYFKSLSNSKNGK